MRYRAVADYYDSEYAHLEMLQCDVPFFLKHTRHRQSILEIAAGTGRAAIPLAQAGHRVVGIDSDRHMLRIAHRKRESVGLRQRQLDLLAGDMRGFDLGRKFDWVCLFFNTFLLLTTLKEQDRALQAFRRHLKPRGRFWLDIFQPNLALLAQESSVDLEPCVFHVPHLDRTVYRSTDVRRDPSWQVQNVMYHYRWFDSRGMEHHESLSFDLTFLFPRELQLLIERNGMEVERMYGDHDGTELNADSPRIIACCRLRT